MSMTDFDLAVVGGGPSGLFAAITAAKRHMSVIVFEHLEAPGKKLLSTGSGRCNLTNMSDFSAFIQKFKEQGSFIRSSYKRFNNEHLISFFNDSGCMTICPDGFHVYPSTQKSAQILNVLLEKCCHYSIIIRNSTHVSSIDFIDDSLCRIKTNAGIVKTKAVILATGAKSYRNLGSDGSGFDLAMQAGHAIIAPVPALVNLQSAEAWPSTLSGLTVENARVVVTMPKHKRNLTQGNLLFTHKGISGPSVLDISGIVSRMLHETGNHIALRLKVIEGQRETWTERFTHWQQHKGQKQTRLLLADHMQSRLATLFCTLSGTPLETRAADLPKSLKNKLLDLIDVGLPLTIKSTDSFDTAMVTSGGVSRDEIDPSTLRSVRKKNLYFCGEVIDVDGPCGGYNLQWAFSSGYTAGMSCIDKCKIHSNT